MWWSKSGASAKRRPLPAGVQPAEALRRVTSADETSAIDWLRQRGLLDGKGPFNWHGTPLLQIAAHNRRVGVVRALLACCDPNEGEPRAIEMAASVGDEEIFELLRRKTKVDGPLAERIVFAAAKGGSAAIVRKALGWLAAPGKIRDTLGRTPLMAAAEAGETGSLAELARVCDAKATDRSGMSALMLAARNGHEKTILALMEASDHAAREEWGLCAFEWAAQEKKWACADLLAARAPEDSAEEAFALLGDEAAKKLPRYAAEREGRSIRRAMDLAAPGGGGQAISSAQKKAAEAPGGKSQKSERAKSDDASPAQGAVAGASAATAGARGARRL
jgi:hypothetical protein